MLKSLFGSLIAVYALAALPMAAAGPVVTVGSPSVLFNYTSGGAAPGVQTVSVTADVDATLTGISTSYISGGNPGWLTVFPSAPFNTPNSLSLFATPTNLPVGNYIAQITLSGPGLDPSSSLIVTVFLAITGTSGGTFGETITASPTAMTFGWAAGSPLPTPQTISVTVSDAAAFTVTRTTDNGMPWLSVTPASSTSPGTVTVSVDPTGLSTGTYNGVITLTAPFSVVQVPVAFNVTGPGLSPSPATVSLSVPQNYGVSGPQFVQITSTGNLPFQVSASSETNWLQVDVASGITPATIQIRANVSGLPQGTYQGNVNVRSGGLTSTDIPVTLTVGPPAPIGLQPASLSFNYTIGDPIPATQTTRVSSLSSVAQTFTSSAITSDGTAWLLASPNQNTTPAVMTVRVTPTNLLAGSYTGIVNIIPSLANAAPQPIQVSLTVKAPPPPVIVSANSSASYSSTAISPGEFLTLFGSAIGPRELAVPPAGTAPRTLGNTTVTFDGIPAPILYASNTQTGVQVPYSVVAGQQSSVVVTYNNLSSPVSKINVVAASPGLFTADSSGKGQAAAVNINPTEYNSAANPVARGAVISLYGTGEGQTTPAVIEGTITPVVQPIPATQLPVSVTIGNQVAQVLYAGEAPASLVGLFQLNVRVPDTAPTGSAVPVLVFVNGIPSQSLVTIAIK